MTAHTETGLHGTQGGWSLANLVVLLLGAAMAALGAASFSLDWLQGMAAGNPAILSIFLVSSGALLLTAGLALFVQTRRSPNAAGKPPRAMNGADTAALSCLPEEEAPDASNGMPGGLELMATNRILAWKFRRVFELLDSAEDGMIAIDPQGNVVFANQASAPFLKESPESAEGQALTQILAHPDLAEFLEEEGREPRPGVRVKEFGQEKEGDERRLAAFLTFAIGKDGEHSGQFLLFRDMSTLRNIENLQTSFIDSVAHELRTPLTSIRAYVEMLVDGEAEDEQSKFDFYNVIQEETFRLSQLVDNLLEISMLESGKAKLDIAGTRIKRIIEESLEVIRPQCEQKNIILVADLQDRLPTLDVDKKLFSVALMNILGNAAKYTPDGGTIEVTTANLENEFHIAIKDTGVGIPEADLPRIFEKFYRAATVGEVIGSGVGLATAQQIIKLHGGKIGVKSKEGSGSEFTIELPRTLINTSIGD